MASSRPEHPPSSRHKGNVEVWALGEDRFRITAPGHEQLVTGFDEAERTADALAERLKIGGPTPFLLLHRSPCGSRRSERAVRRREPVI
jgi:hypothetical protein